jgi:uncharacterized protein YndB with AHSA1/START domain
LKCDAKKVFEMFTANEHLEKWLTEKADVELCVWEIQACLEDFVEMKFAKHWRLAKQTTLRKLLISGKRMALPSLGFASN